MRWGLLRTYVAMRSFHPLTFEYMSKSPPLCPKFLPCPSSMDSTKRWWNRESITCSQYTVLPTTKAVAEAEFELGTHGWPGLLSAPLSFTLMVLSNFLVVLCPLHSLANSKTSLFSRTLQRSWFWPVAFSVPRCSTGRPGLALAGTDWDFCSWGVLALHLGYPC